MQLSQEQLANLTALEASFITTVLAVTTKSVAIKKADGGIAVLDIENAPVKVGDTLKFDTEGKLIETKVKEGGAALKPNKQTPSEHRKHDI